MTEGIVSAEMPANSATSSSDDDGEGASITTTTANMKPGNGMSNFLGVSMNNSGTDNFLGVGEMTVNFLGVGGIPSASSAGRETTTDGVDQNQDTSVANIGDIFREAEEERRVFEKRLFGKLNLQSDFDNDTSLVRSRSSYTYWTDNEKLHKLKDDWVAAGKDVLSGSDESDSESLSGAGSNTRVDENNFLGVGQDTDSSQDAENFLEAVPLKRRRHGSEDDRESCVEVKIEIDVADTDFAAEATQPQTNSHTENQGLHKSIHLTRIKQEPGTLATDHVANIVTGIDMERLKSASGDASLSADNCDTEPGPDDYKYNPDFVVKMEPECDTDTVINGTKVVSHGDSDTNFAAEAMQLNTNSHTESENFSSARNGSNGQCEDCTGQKLKSGFHSNDCSDLKSHTVDASRSELYRSWGATVSPVKALMRGEHLADSDDESEILKYFDASQNELPAASDQASHIVGSGETFQRKHEAAHASHSYVAGLDSIPAKVEPEWDNSSHHSSHTPGDSGAENAHMNSEDTDANTTLDQGLHKSIHLTRIKQEPGTLATDHVANIVTGINTERLKSASGDASLSADNCDTEPGPDDYKYSPDFVVKMELEPDEDTVISGTSDLSHDDSSSATEEESCLEKTSQQTKAVKAKKIQKRPNVNTYPYQCQYCDSAFAKKSRLTEHTRSHTDERPYSCQQCSMSFRKSESLKVHFRTHTGELPFQCRDCDSAFKCSQELKRHTVRKHLAVRPFSCSQCDARFFSKADLRGHSRLHTGEKPYKCSDCPAAFRKSSALTCHARIHTGQKPYGCSECQRLFRRSDQLKRHMKLHTGERPYKCQDCDAAFSGMSDLKKHTSRKHSSLKPFTCPECGSKFHTSADLKMHRTFHTGIKPHACAECGAAFVRASDLKVHTRIHTGEKPFACQLCAATFARSGDLKLHLRMHDNTRPFTCSVCNTAFRRSGHLTRHMYTHNGHKAFRCEDCHAAFFTSSDLKRHAARVHKKDVSRFSCDLCQARFFTSRALNIHRMKHTRDRTYPCLACEAAFSHSDLLTAHVESAHKGEEKGGQSVTENDDETNGGQYMYVDVSVICDAELNSSSENLSGVDVLT